MPFALHHFSSYEGAMRRALHPTACYTRSETRTPVLIVPTHEQAAAHAAFVAKLKDPVWMMP
jgi:hypothetical protein